MPGQGRSYMAGEDLSPSRFVTHDGTNDFHVVTCTADQGAVGVTHEGTREAPRTGVTPLAAAEGEPVRVYTIGEPCEVEAGDTIAPGDPLKPDADGKAVPCADGDEYSAFADSAAASGELCKCTVQRGIAVVAGSA